MEYDEEVILLINNIEQFKDVSQPDEVKLAVDIGRILLKRYRSYKVVLMICAIYLIMFLFSKTDTLLPMLGKVILFNPFIAAVVMLIAYIFIECIHIELLSIHCINEGFDKLK